ncbi:MAG: glycosyltransferase [Rikenellaceae bacterium]
MIFVTAGTQSSFDRLIEMIDHLSPMLNEEIIAQCIESKYKAKNIKTIGLVNPDEFNRIFSKARVIIAHAGMGTIISALSSNKPIIVVPRIASFGEHRDDHQISTAMQLNELGFVYVAYDKKQLTDLLNNIDKLSVLKTIGGKAAQDLIDDIIGFIK